MLPLAGLRILAVEQYGAGPFGTMFLADQGAEVIKIENPGEGGDMARRVGPYFFEPGDSLFFHSFNRNKRSLTLDLATPDGQAVLHDLVESADALALNLRGDVPAKLGLDYDHLAAHNPRIVCAHLTAYGRTGPGGAPTRFGLSIVDLMTGLAMAFALLTGLTAARASGVGRDIDVSLFDVALGNLSYLATWYLNEGMVQERLPRSAHPSLTPCQMFPTADGWIFIMCNKEKFWPALCRALSKPEWADDPRFRTFEERRENREIVAELLDGELQKRTTAKWLELFAGSVPAAPIYDIAEALDSPFVADDERIQTSVHPSAGAYRMVASPVRSAGETQPVRPAPALGADTEDILRGLGYDGTRIEALRGAKVI
jgi:crotonobetainyl-CoA:carnitine CoA-transferase CaiB-like acyl-CoA transferase